MSPQCHPSGLGRAPVRPLKSHFCWDGRPNWVSFRPGRTGGTSQFPEFRWDFTRLSSRHPGASGRLGERGAGLVEFADRVLEVASELAGVEAGLGRTVELPVGPAARHVVVDDLVPCRVGVQRGAQQITVA